MCHNIAKDIKPGVDSKTTDIAHCGLLKSCMLGRRCINCSYNNVAKGIRLLDKKIVYTGNISCKLELLKDVSP